MSPRRPAFATAAALLATSLLAGCNFELDDNALDPQGGRSISKDAGPDKVWRVRWDNPPIGSLYQMPSIGFAKRVTAGWEYNKFDLEAEVTDADGKHRLYTWPDEFGTYGDDEGSFFFETHGTKLLPMVPGDATSSITTARALYDTYNAPEQVYQDPLGNTEGRFQLDPAVGLVPLRVIVLDGPGLAPEFPLALSPGWLSKASAELLFDDRWAGAKGKNTQPGYSPDNVVTGWTHRPGIDAVAESATSGGGWYLQPDRVLDRCDAQVRMVSYHKCTVPADIVFTDECGTSLGQTAHLRAIKDAILEGCGVPDDMTWVVFAGSLSSGNCFGGTLQGAELDGDAYIALQGAGKSTLSHELGHVLGLNHNSISGNLMAPGSGIALTDDQCTTVNARAHDLQAAYWTTTKYTGNWENFAAANDALQGQAQNAWRGLSTTSLAGVTRVLGRSHVTRLQRALFGTPAAWAAARPHLETLVLTHQRELEAALTADDLARLRRLFGG
jgi:hypothetical protein